MLRTQAPVAIVPAKHSTIGSANDDKMIPIVINIESWKKLEVNKNSFDTAEVTLPRDTMNYRNFDALISLSVAVPTCRKE